MVGLLCTTDNLGPQYLTALSKLIVFKAANRPNNVNIVPLVTSF